MEVKDLSDNGSTKSSTKYSHVADTSIDVPESPDTTSSRCSIDSLIKQKVEDDTWVQCENPNCLKWRRINKVAAECLNDAPWYCFMNTNEKYSSCEDKEEDYKEFEKLAKRCKLKYVASPMEEGTLVWARMIGYCSWPGIITKDPITGYYIDIDQDGHPSSYHIEFLGEQHSHGWVFYKQVYIYGKVGNSGSIVTASSNNDKDMSNSRVNRKKKSGRVVSIFKREARNSYKGKSVEFARAEADKLVDVLPHERLERIVYKDDTISGSKGEDKLLLDSTAKRNQTKRKATSSMEKATEISRTKGRGRPPGSKKRKLENSKTLSNHPVCSSISPVDRKHLPHGNSATSPLWLKTGASMDIKLKESASLQGRSKEEKYVLDVEIHQKNQDGFDHDLNRFMRNQGLKLSKAPCWKDIHVTFYQLFVAVHDRGGFHQVTQKKEWAKVYKEVTNNPVSNAIMVRKLYWKNLLPYELYVNGEEYKDLIEQIKLNHPKSCISKECNTREIATQDLNADKVTGEKGHRQQQGNENFSSSSSSSSEGSDTDTASSSDEDMKALFQQLQETGKMLTYDVLEDNVRKDSERMDLSVKFYGDDKNSALENVTSPETAIAVSNDEPAQIVPETLTSSSSGYGEDSSVSQVSSGNEQVLNAMEALQRELDAMKTELIKQWQ